VLNLTVEQILQILGSLAGGIGAYAAIRADLAALKERVNNADSNIERIDRTLERAVEKMIAK
jgi:hypothetical protein